MERKAATSAQGQQQKTKKPYRKPEVIVYGNIREITRNVGPKGNYNNDCGNPVLRVISLLDGKYYRFCYADKTEFVIDEAGTEIWADWVEPLTLEDTATYLLGPIMGFVMLLRGVVCLHASAVVID